MSPTPITAHSQAGGFRDFCGAVLSFELPLVFGDRRVTFDDATPRRLKRDEGTSLSMSMLNMLLSP